MGRQMERCQCWNGSHTWKEEERVGCYEEIHFSSSSTSSEMSAAVARMMQMVNRRWQQVNESRQAMEVARKEVGDVRDRV